MNYQAPNRVHNNNRPSSTGSRPATRKTGNGPRMVARPKTRKESTLSIIKTNIKPMIAVREERVKTVKAKARKPFPMSAVVMLTICTLLLMFLVVSYVQINEYTIEVASLRGELSDLVGQRKELALALEEKNDMVKIEQYATENLGMVKSDQLTKKYISLEQEDKIEVVETAPADDVTVVSGVMSAVGENFQGLWEYLD